MSTFDGDAQNAGATGPSRAELKPLDTKLVSREPNPRKGKNDNLDSAIMLEKQPSPVPTTSSIDFGGRTTWLAWVLTICISLHNAACTIMWQTASSAAITTSEWMNASLTQVNWLSNVSAIANCVFSIIGAWAYERFGIKTCLIFSGVMNVLGCWIRCLAIVAGPAHRYPVVLLGQIIASIGGPFVYNISSKFVALWFAPADRGLGNMLTALSFGQIIIPVAGPLLAHVPEETPRSFIIVAIISTVAAIPLLIMPKKPKEAPSASACASRTSVWDGMKALVRSAQFWSVAIITSFNAGMFFAISVIVVQAAAPYGYTETQTGVGGSLSAVAGYLGGAMTGYWAGRSFQHLMILKMFTPMLCATYIMLIFEIVPNAYVILLFSIMLIGFFSMGLLPIQLEYACELMYPIPESVVSNLIWAFISAAMLIFTIISDSLRAGPDATPPENMHNSLIASAVLLCVGSLPCLWLKGDMKRLKVDKSEQVPSDA